MCKLAGVKKQTLRGWGLAENMSETSAGLFDVGDLRLGNGFGKVENSPLWDICFHRSLWPWGQGNTRKWTFTASSYQGRKLKLISWNGVSRVEEPPGGNGGVGDSLCLHSMPACLQFTQTVSSGQAEDRTA